MVVRYKNIIYSSLDRLINVCKFFIFTLHFNMIKFFIRIAYSGAMCKCQVTLVSSVKEY